MVLVVKNLQVRHKRCRLDPWLRKIPWRKAQQSTPVFLPAESHGQRILVRYSLGDDKRVGHDSAHTHSAAGE